MFGAASLVAGLFNYLYHVVLAHALGPNDYGDLTTFLNVTALLLLPGSVLTLIYTRLGKRSRQSRGASIALWVSGFLLWGLMVALSLPLGRVLRVSPLLLAVFTLEVLPSMALAANLGVLQRVRWYFWVGLIGVVNTGFRVISAGLGAFLHVHTLFWVGLLEGIAAWAAWYWSRVKVRQSPEVGEPSRADVISGTAVVGILNVLFSIGDGLMAKHSMAPGPAGLFNGLATIGHTVQFIAGSLGTVLLTSIIAEPERRARLLAVTLAIYAAVAGLSEVVFIWDSRGLVRAVLGVHFLSDAAWLPYYGWGMMALGLLNILMLYSVAEKHWELIVSTAMGLVYWIWVLGRSHTVGAYVRQTTHTMVITFILTVGVMMLATWLRRGDRAKVPRRVRS